MSEYIEREKIQYHRNYQKDGAWFAYKSEIERIPPSDVMPIYHCSTCGRNADNGGMYEDGRTMCPIQEHYALLRDGFCHLYSPAKPYNCGAKTNESTAFDDHEISGLLDD